MAFQFKQFSIEQSVNSHKVGTDSMLLGAWTKGHFKSILDIGTGTGILALMQAQQQIDANVVGLEIDPKACKEAQYNFEKSPFKNRVNAVCCDIQNYEPGVQYDLIISNPPFFDKAFLSENPDRNRTRHTVNLSIEALYVNVKRLLKPEGRFNVIVPSDLYNKHVNIAKQYHLYPNDILIVENENNISIRHLISFTSSQVNSSCNRMIAKYSSGLYSQAYVELTTDFHDRVLPFRSSV